MAEPAGRAREHWRHMLPAVLAAALCLGFSTPSLADEPAAPSAQAGPAQAVLSAQDDADLAQRQRSAQAERELAAQAVLAGDTAAWEQHARLVLELAPEPQAYLDLIYGLQAIPGRERDGEKLWTELLTRYPDAPQVLLARARELIKTRKYTAAGEVLTRALELAPGDPAPLYWLGRCLEATQSPAAALPYYQQAVERDYAPDRVAALARVVELLSGAAAAEVVWEKQLLAHPDDAELHFRHGLRVRDDNLPLACAEFQRCVELEPQNCQYLQHLAQASWDSGEIEASLELWRKLLALQPTASYYCNYAQLLLDAYQVEEALAVCAAGRAVFPTDDLLLLAQYRALLAAGRTADAVDLALTTGATNGDAALLSTAGRDALERKDSEAARRIYLAFAAAQPEAALKDPWYLTWGLQSGQEQELLAAVTALKAEGQPGAYFRVLSALGLANPDPPKLDQAFAKLLELDPHDLDLYFVYTARLASYGRYSEALEVLRRGQNDAGGSQLLRAYEAVCVAQLSGVAAAEPLLQAIRDDQQAEAGDYLVLLRLLPGDTPIEVLLELGTAGQARWPQEPYIPLYLAADCVRAGDYASALTALNNPALAGASMPELPYLAGKSYLFLGNYPKALAHLLRVHRRGPYGNSVQPLLARAFYFAGELNAARKALDATDSVAATPAANTWLGLVQLKAGEVEAARQSFAKVRAVEHAPAADLAWCALGEARLALFTGDKPAASACLSEAAGYGVKDDALFSEIDATRKELQR